MKNWKIVLAILTANVVFMAASYTMLIPFLPMYLITELGVSQDEVKLWSGAIFSITFLIGGILSPVWGRMADKKGKKLMAIRSGLGLSIAYLLGAFVTTPEQMFGVRVLHGFAAGLWAVCLAIATSSVPLDKLGISLGIMQSGLTVGNVVGPLLGGILASCFGMRASFMVGGLVLLIITIIFYLYIPEPPKSEANVSVKKREKASALYKQPAIRQALIYAGLVQMVILLIQPMISLYVAELNHSMDNIVFVSGLVFSLVGIASALTAPLWGRFGQRNGFYKSLALAAMLAGIATLSTAVPDTLIVFAALNFVVGLFFAGINPSLSAILANKTTQDQKGQVFGFMFSAQQFGSMIGPLLGGVIATYYPIKSVFILAGIILLGISVTVFMTHKNEQEV